MKKASKIFAFLVIISLLLVSLAACGGLQGEQGPQGEQGEPGLTRQIATTWADIYWDEVAEKFKVYQAPFFWYGMSAFTIVDVTVWDYEEYPPEEACWVRIKGSGFDPNDEVVLTIGDDDYVLDLYYLDYDLGVLVDIGDNSIYPNLDGAFEVFSYMPDIWPELELTYVVHTSVTAWVDDEVRAFWALDVWNTTEFNWDLYHRLFKKVTP